MSWFNWFKKEPKDLLYRTNIVKDNKVCTVSISRSQKRSFNDIYIISIEYKEFTESKEVEIEYGFLRSNPSIERDLYFRLIQIFDTLPSKIDICNINTFTYPQKRRVDWIIEVGNVVIAFFKHSNKPVSVRDICLSVNNKQEYAMSNVHGFENDGFLKPYQIGTGCVVWGDKSFEEFEKYLNDYAERMKNL